VTDPAEFLGLIAAFWTIERVATALSFN